MSWHKDRGPGERRGYHHGNLREALIEAALDAHFREGARRLHVRRGGARGRRLSCRALPPFPRPRRAYRRRGQARLRGLHGRARQAWDGGKPSPRAAFDRRRARLSRVRARGAGLFRGHVRIRAVARRLSGACAPRATRRSACCGMPARRSSTRCPHVPKERRPPALMMALHIWSLSHGIATLFARGDRSRRPIPMQPEELLEAAVLDLPRRARPREAVSGLRTRSLVCEPSPAPSRIIGFRLGLSTDRGPTACSSRIPVSCGNSGPSALPYQR